MWLEFRRVLFRSAALCLYFLIADGVQGAEVLLASNSKAQAKISFEMCQNFAKTIDKKGKYLTCYRAAILFPKTNSKMKVLAADSSRLDGYNAIFALIDEYHEAATSKVKDVIYNSMLTRPKAHLCTITTAGLYKTNPCYARRTMCCELLHHLTEYEHILPAF